MKKYTLQTKTDHWVLYYHSILYSMLLPGSVIQKLKVHRGIYPPISTPPHPPVITFPRRSARTPLPINVKENVNQSDVTESHDVVVFNSIYSTYTYSASVYMSHCINRRTCVRVFICVYMFTCVVCVFVYICVCGSEGLLIGARPRELYRRCCRWARGGGRRDGLR